MSEGVFSSMCLFMVIKAVSSQVIKCCVIDKSKQNKQHKHVIIAYMFDCWAVLHLLLKRSMID